MKIFKQKYKTPTKEEFPPIVTYHDKRYGGTKVDEQGRFYTVEDETQRLFRWERMIRKKERQQEQLKTWIAIKEGKYHKKNFYLNGGNKQHFHWVKMPKSKTGGKLSRKLDGGWVEEYKPVKSTRLHKWLQLAKEGRVFNGQKHRTKQFLIKQPVSQTQFAASASLSVSLCLSFKKVSCFSKQCWVWVPH